MRCAQGSPQGLTHVPGVCVNGVAAKHMNSFGHGLRTAAMLAQLTFVLALLLQAGAVLEQGRAHHLGTRTTSPSSHGSILLGHDGQLEFTPKQRRGVEVASKLR